jgi:hypothetical protein
MTATTVTGLANSPVGATRYHPRPRGAPKKLIAEFEETE